MTPPHLCHHPKCDVEVPPDKLACRGHWYSLPEHLRADIWRTYRRGQERDKNPSRDYVDAAIKCREWWEAHPARAR